MDGRTPIEVGTSVLLNSSGLSYPYGMPPSLTLQVMMARLLPDSLILQMHLSKWYLESSVLSQPTVYSPFADPDVTDKIPRYRTTTERIEYLHRRQEPIPVPLQLPPFSDTMDGWHPACDVRACYFAGGVYRLSYRWKREASQQYKNHHGAYKIQT